MAKENSSEKKKMSFFPKLDYVDGFSLSLWLLLFIPAIQLPFDATHSFPRTVLFVLWLVAFALYVVVKMLREKRLLFYSASFSNVAILALLLTFSVSFALSASPVDSLYGYNVTFFTSSFILLSSVVALYLVLRLAGLSLEVQVSRFLSTLPYALAIADIISILFFLVPYTAYEKVLGGMAQYYAFLTLSPFALLGNLAQSALVHVIALIVILYQVSQVVNVKKHMNDFVRRGLVSLILAVSGSYLIFFTYPVSTSGSASLWVAYALIALGSFAFSFMLKNEQRSRYMKWLGIVIVTILLLGVLWSKLGFTSKNTIANLTRAETASIVKNSFLNKDKPVWRQIVGYGTGTFPYLYFEQRSLEAARNLGSEVYLYYPSNFISEVFVEHGILGIIAFGIAIYAVLKALYAASNKSVVALELQLLFAIAVINFYAPSFLFLYVLAFVTMASFFDKVESLPEALPRIRAIELKETLYTNRSINRSSVALLVSVSILSVVGVWSLYKPTLSVVGYARAISRYYVANAQVQKQDNAALATYESAFSLASKYQKYCKDCTQLSSLQAVILMRLKNMYTGLTEEQRSQSSEYQNIRFLLAQIAPELTIKNSQQYDYWLTSAQIYKSFAFEENSDTLKALALSSTNNALTLNPYSVPAHYLYIDLLISLGNSETVNSRITQVLAELKQLVNSPPQVRIIEAILLARSGKYDESLSALEKIKTEVESDGRYSDSDKKAIISVVDSTIKEITTAKSGSKTPTKTDSDKTTEPKPTPTITPSITVTPTPTPTHTPTPSPTT